MAIIDRPNRDMLDKAIGIYRDSMRGFLVRHLKRVPKHNLQSAVESALASERSRSTAKQNNLESHLKRGGAVDDFIDVGEFHLYIGHHWGSVSVFDGVFKEDRQIILAHCRFIASARNHELPGREG